MSAKTEEEISEHNFQQVRIRQEIFQMITLDVSTCLKESCVDRTDPSLVPHLLGAAVRNFVELLQMAEFLPKHLSEPALEKINELMMMTTDAAVVGLHDFATTNRIIVPS